MTATNAKPTDATSDNSPAMSPTEVRRVAGNVKDVIRYAKGKVSRPQFDRAMRHYDNHLLSSQTARDVERLVEHTANLVRRGVSFERATLWVPVLVAGVREILGPAIDGPLTLHDLHRAEEIAEGHLDVCECDFIDDPSNKAKAIAYLDARAKYLAVSGHIEAKALAVAGR